MKLYRTTVAALFLMLCVTAGAADRRYIVKPRPDAFKQVPFSDGVRVGDTLYLAGHLGLDLKTGQPPESAEAEARFFEEDAIPELSVMRVTAEQIARLFQHYRHPDWPADLD